MAESSAAQNEGQIFDLIAQVRDLYETDRGDFKRKALLYLNRFEQQDLKAAPISEIRDMILCDSSQDIEALRQKIIRALKALSRFY